MTHLAYEVVRYRSRNLNPADTDADSAASCPPHASEGANNAMGDRNQLHGQNVIGGKVRGTFVQAQTIQGNVRIDQPRTVIQFASTGGRRTARIRDVLRGLTVLASGGYSGMCAAGLFSTVTGQVLRPGSGWLTGLPALAVFGACLGLIVALATRQRWLPRLRCRTTSFIVAGVVTFPLAVAVPEEGHGEVGIILYLAGVLVVVGIAAVRSVLNRRG